MSQNPYQDDRGNKDRSITSGRPQGEIPLKKSGKTSRVEGDSLS